MVKNAENIEPTLAQIMNTPQLNQDMIKRLKEWRGLTGYGPYTWDSEVKACKRVEELIRTELRRPPHRFIWADPEVMMICLDHLLSIATPTHREKMISFNYISRNFRQIFASAGIDGNTHKSA